MAVIDASVLLRATVKTSATPLAMAAISRPAAMAPDFIAVEIANALWRYVRAGQLDAMAAEGLLREATATIRLVPVSQELLAAGLRLACEARHPVYDCVYVALALSEQTGIVTADVKLAELARKKRIAVELLP